MKYFLRYLPLSYVEGANDPRQFGSEYDARQTLLKHICEECLNGACTYIGDGKLVTEYIEEAPDKNCIQDLLGTNCGCEWDYWEED